ncbi:MAG: ABC transporter ATP-binding protein [Epsilonproteobacteria bacterium]|nr:MAG: ABC transporter ATP-binding protein [Campylobacterota bacterium]
MIQIKNLTKKFDNHKSLDDINLNINIGDSIALMGANGAGKTTLVRSILGFYHTDNGSISIDGLDPIKDRVEVLQKISFVPQLPPPIKLNVYELLEYVSKSSGIEIKTIKQFANELKLNIDENIKKSFFSLSGGMKQKLLIAISLSKKSDIIIYDEPTANLDPKARDDFYRILKQNNDNKVLLFVTHRIEEVQNMTNRKIYMDMGKIVSDEITD